MICGGGGVHWLGEVEAKGNWAGDEMKIKKQMQWYKVVDLGRPNVHCEIHVNFEKGKWWFKGKDLQVHEGNVWGKEAVLAWWKELGVDVKHEKVGIYAEKFSQYAGEIPFYEGMGQTEWKDIKHFGVRAIPTEVQTYVGIRDGFGKVWLGVWGVGWLMGCVGVWLLGMRMKRRDERNEVVGGEESCVRGGLGLGLVGLGVVAVGVLAIVWGILYL